MKNSIYFCSVEQTVHNIKRIVLCINFNCTTKTSEWTFLFCLNEGRQTLLGIRSIETTQKLSGQNLILTFAFFD